jgi:hypothetical protein
VRFTTPAGLPRLFAAINNATPEALDIGPLVTFHVVGLGAIPGQLPPIGGGGLPQMSMTPAWQRVYASQLAHTDSLAARLRHGEADLNAFKSAVEKMAGGQPVLFHTQRDSTATVQRSFRSQAVSLYIQRVSSAWSPCCSSVRRSPGRPGPNPAASPSRP